MAAQAELDRGSKIVIIGSGVVGAALADEFVLRGYTNILVVEQGPLYLTGGSSSHAPGFVFQTNGSRTMTELARRTLDKLDALDLDGQWLLKRVGGLEIATTPERLEELKRRHSLATAWGIPGRLVPTAECLQLWPGLNPEIVLGGFFTPTDGVVSSKRAVEAQARRAVAGGAEFREFTRVVDLVRDGGTVAGVVVENSLDPQGTETIAADVVVAAGGLWGPTLGRLAGVELPMLPVEHCFATTAPVPSLAGVNDELDEASKPLLRHQDFALYLREYNDRIGIGAYNHRPIGLDQDQIASTREFQDSGVHPAIHPFTAADFDPSWKEARRLLPELDGVELAEGFNGIFSFTPDGGPMLGEVAHLQGMWIAQAVWVTHSAGVAQVMADWITTGNPGIDTHGLDFNRFDPGYVSRDFIRGRSEESYDEVYDIIHPRRSTNVLRGLRTSPYHLRMEQLGAVFGEGGGWERPLWFESNAALLEELGLELPERSPWDSTCWSPIAAAEAFATRNRAAMYDMTPLARYEVSGTGAEEFLQRVTTNNVAKSVGSVTYALMLDEFGGILSDVTVTRLAADRFMIGGNGNLDLVHLQGLLPADGSVAVRDITPGTCCIGLWGPQARNVLGKLTDADISHEGFKYFRAKQFHVAGVAVTALRVSYVGELGWELYTTADQGLRLWDCIAEAGREYGIVPAGRLAFNALRMEKGYRSWGTDMSREHTPEEAGLGFAVSARKGDFVGSAALAARDSGRRLVTVVLDDRGGMAAGGEPVFVPGAGSPVGYVTSADYGYSIDAFVAYAWVPQELAAPGTRLEISYFGRRQAGTVRPDALFDPDLTHIRR